MTKCGNEVISVIKFETWEIAFYQKFDKIKKINSSESTLVTWMSQEWLSTQSLLYVSGTREPLPPCGASDHISPHVFKFSPFQRQRLQHRCVCSWTASAWPWPMVLAPLTGKHTDKTHCVTFPIILYIQVGLRHYILPLKILTWKQALVGIMLSHQNFRYPCYFTEILYHL